MRARTRRRTATAIWRHRDFRFLWFGETTSAVGTSVSRLALPLVAVVTLQASTFEVTVLTAATWLPWLLVGLPAGAWVDRLPRRPLLLACNLFSAGLLLSVPVADWSGTVTMTHLLAVALLTGTASVLFETAFAVYLPTVVDDAALPAANAALQGSESAAQVAGPGVAGLVARAVGAVGGLVVDAATFLVSATCLLLVRAREDRMTAPATRPGVRREIAEGLRFLGHDPYLRVLAVFGAASNVALTGYQSLLVVFLVRDIGLGPAAVGLVLSAMSAGGILGAAVAGRLTRRLGTARGLLVCQFAAAPCALLIPFTTPGPGLVFVVAGGIGVGAGIVAGNVIKSSFRQIYTPRPVLGRVLVSMHFLNYGTIPLGALVAGALGTAFGLRPALWVMTAGLLVAACVLLVGPLRHQRDLPAAPALPEPVGAAPS